MTWMVRIPYLLMVFLFAAAVGAQPAAPKRAARVGAPKRDEAPSDDELHAKLVATARAAFVTVHITLRKDPEEMAEPGTTYYREPEGPEDQARTRVHRLVDDDRTLDLPGLWLDAKGTVLIQDLGLETKYFEKIEVRTGGGTVFPASLQSVLQGAPGWLLAAQGAGPFPAPRFAPTGDLQPPIELAGAGLEEIHGVWSLSFGGVGGPTVPLAGDAAGPAYLALGEEERPERSVLEMDFPRRPFLLLFNDDADPVGVALHPLLSLDDRGPAAWRGETLKSDPALPFDALDALGRKIVEAADRSVGEVKLTFRMDTPDDEREGPWGAAHFRRLSSRRFGAEEGEGGRETTDYGFAISPRRFFVASEMSEAVAARIEKIEVSLPGRAAPCAAKFVGAYKAFAGYVVEADESVVPAPPDRDAVEAFPFGRPIPTLRVVKKYGRRKSLLGYARILAHQRGYQHRLYAVPDPPLAPGTLLFDLEGRPAGFVARLRRDDEKVRALRDTQQQGYARWDGGLHSEDSRLFLFRDVREALSAPEAALDPDIRVKSKFEERRRVWLGVECCTLNKELSRQMGIEGPTKSGQIGLLVVDVYDDSPARRLGLKEGDVLLKIQEKGKKEPVELRSAEQDFPAFLSMLPGMPESEEEEVWLSEPPWRPQRNALTTVLTTIGKGKTVVVSCLVDHRDVEKELVLEEGPPDFESATRKKHEATGLTVRDLTYEVRKALRLAQDAPGAVVSKVEEGFPAAVVKIHPFDVIQRVDGKDVSGVEALMSMFQSAQASGVPSVKVQILRLNRTRFLDLRFEVEKKGEGPEAKEAK